MSTRTDEKHNNAVTYTIRGLTVMIDCDLAAFFGVKTKIIRQAVRRNSRRFPEDFMFIPSASEIEDAGRDSKAAQQEDLRNAPMAFTEQGIAMLSSVLDCERAADMNIEIMRTFTRMFEMLCSHEELIQKIESIEKSMKKNS